MPDPTAAMETMIEPGTEEIIAPKELDERLLTQAEEQGVSLAGSRASVLRPRRQVATKATAPGHPDPQSDHRA